METLRTSITPRECLERELSRRIRRNPHYSMRSFASALGISHTLLSLVLNGKKPVSTKLLKKLVTMSTMSRSESHALQDHLARAGGVRAGDNDAGFDDISLDHFALISDWYHYVILSLLEIPDAKLDAKWVARALAISPAEATLAIARLKRLRLLKQTEGVWKQSSLPLKIDNKISTEATRKHHKQILEKAAESLENDPMTHRDFSCVTFALDPQYVGYAEKRITQFRRELMKELEDFGDPKEVYQMAIQLFPVTHLSNQEKKS